MNITWIYYIWIHMCILKIIENIYTYTICIYKIYATPPPPRGPTFQEVHCVGKSRWDIHFASWRRWEDDIEAEETWYDLDAACNLALSRCHSLCSILSQQSRGKAPLVLMGRADRLHGYMRRTYFWNFRKTPLFAIYPFLLYWIAHIIICLSFVFMY